MVTEPVDNIVLGGQIKTNLYFYHTCLTGNQDRHNGILGLIYSHVLMLIITLRTDIDRGNKE